MSAKVRNNTSLTVSTRKPAILIFFLAFLIYANSINNNYALDDNYVTVTTPEQPNNPRIEKGLRGIPEIFTTHYIESADQSFEYRPVPLCTYAIEYQFFGCNPHISHFINVLFYAFTCVILFSVLSILLKGYNVAFPFLVTILFALHPIHTEVVNNLKCRDELLSFFFGILGLYFFVKQADGKRWVSFLLAGLCLLTALLCKKTAIMFVVLLPLTNYFFTDTKLKNLVLQLVFFYFVFVVFTLFERFLGGENFHRDFAFFENPLFYNDGFFQRLSLACYTVGYYFKLFVFPYPLSSYYGFDTIPSGGMITVFIIVSAVFYLSTGVYALIKLPSKSIFSYGILIYLLGIVPFANVIDPVVGVIAERFVYFSSLGFCIAAVAFLFTVFKIDVRSNEQGLKALPSIFRNVMIIVFVFFSILIFSRNSKWKDSMSLFSEDVKHFEDSYFLNYFLANTLNNEAAKLQMGYKKDYLFKESRKYYAQAAAILRRGVGIYDTDYYTISTLGTLYVNYLDKVDAAIPCFKRSLQLKPGYEVAQYNLYFCYERKNMPDLAISSYEKMVQKGTKYLPVFYRLHELYLKKNEFNKAVETDLFGLKKMPGDIKLHINLGNAYMLNKDTLNGIKYFEEAVSLAPTDYRLLNNLISVLKATGRTTKSISYEKKAAILAKNLKK